MSSKTDTEKGPDANPRDHLILLMGMVKGLCFIIRTEDNTASPRLQTQAAYVETRVNQWLVDMGMVGDGRQET